MLSPSKANEDEGLAVRVREPREGRADDLEHLLGGELGVRLGTSLRPGFAAFRRSSTEDDGVVALPRARVVDEDVPRDRVAPGDSLFLLRPS